MIFDECIFLFQCDDLFQQSVPVVVDQAIPASPSPTVVDETSKQISAVVSTNSPLINTHAIMENDIPTTSSCDTSGLALEQDKKRSSKPPAYLQDYFCNMIDTEIPYPLAAYMSYDKLSEDYKAYICAINLHPEPTSLNQAKNFEEWIQAMNEELIALENTNTWYICSLPPSKHAIECKWVYKVKLLDDGNLERYKAHLVAKGYTK